MKVRISDHFNYRKLFGFVLPSVIMLVVTSVYTVIDGFFVSNFVGKTPFAAVNLIMPVIMIFGGFGFMIGTGGTAYVSMLIGKGEKDEANRCFTALNNGLISAVLSVLRTLVFQIACVYIARDIRRRRNLVGNARYRNLRNRSFGRAVYCVSEKIQLCVKLGNVHK